MDEQNTDPKPGANPDPFHKPREEDDFRAASQATAQEDAYDDYIKQGKSYTAPSGRGKKIAILVAVLVLLAALVFGAYWLFIRKDSGNNADKKTNTAANTNDDQNDDNTQSSLIAEDTEHHNSSQFMLEFDYPKDWKVNDEAGSGKLVVTSPKLSLQDANGKDFDGQVVFTIRNKQQSLPEFDKGNATAARESLKINYAKPSQVQRASTYISFLRYATSANAKGLDGVYVTGDVGYQKDQAVPKADFTPVDPVIGITFTKCGDDACSAEGESTNIASGMWDEASFGKRLQSMLQSLVIN